MRKKKNKAGNMQNYDSKGRYCEDPIKKKLRLESEKAAKEAHEYERKIRNRLTFLENLRNRVARKNDPYLCEAFDLIANARRDCIIDANFKTWDDVNHCNREFDIRTKRCLIEVKKTGKGSSNQLLAQKAYCDKKNLYHIVYSPEMPYGRVCAFRQKGLTIITKRNGLTDIIKRYEK